MKRGRPLLLGEELDTKVREGGGIVTARIAMGAACGILRSSDRFRLAEFGGPVELNPHWAYRLLDRMHFVRKKATTAKSKYILDSIADVKKSFLADAVNTVSMEDIPLELILNWDQRGIKIVPSSDWTMEQQGAKRVEIVRKNDK